MVDPTGIDWTPGGPTRVGRWLCDVTDDPATGERVAMLLTWRETRWGLRACFAWGDYEHSMTPGCVRRHAPIPDAEHVRTALLAEVAAHAEALAHEQALVALQKWDADAPCSAEAHEYAAETARGVARALRARLGAGTTADPARVREAVARECAAIADAVQADSVPADGAAGDFWQGRARGAGWVAGRIRARFGLDGRVPCPDVQTGGAVQVAQVPTPADGEPYECPGCGDKGVAPAQVMYCGACAVNTLRWVWDIIENARAAYADRAAFSTDPHVQAEQAAGLRAIAALMTVLRGRPDVEAVAADREELARLRAELERERDLHAERHRRHVESEREVERLRAALTPLASGEAGCLTTAEMQRVREALDAGAARAAPATDADGRPRPFGPGAFVRHRASPDRLDFVVRLYVSCGDWYYEAQDGSAAKARHARVAPGERPTPEQVDALRGRLAYHREAAAGLVEALAALDSEPQS